MPGGATLPSLISRTRLQLHDSSTPFANAGADTDKAVNRLDQSADVDAFARNRRQSQLLIATSYHTAWESLPTVSWAAWLGL